MMKIKDLPGKAGTGKLLRQLNYVLKGNPYYKITGWLADPQGNFAYVTNKGIFVAKGYNFGYLVSCHLRAVVAAINQKKPLIMYLKNQDRFYRFDPSKILESGQENLKGEARMINFNIKLGRRIEI